MTIWILQRILLSVLVIFLIHQIINYFKNKLTKPKIIDLVDTPEKKYKNILNTLQSSYEVNTNKHTINLDNTPLNNTPLNNTISDTTSIDNLAPINNTSKMQNKDSTMLNELQSHFNNISNHGNHGNHENNTDKGTSNLV